MGTKHFIISNSKEDVCQEEIIKSKKEKERIYAQSDTAKKNNNLQILSSEETLIHVEGKVIVKVDLQAKNQHTFSDGTVIRRERQFDNFNRRETEAVNAICVSGEGIKAGAEILIHHNATSETNRITNYKNTLGSDIAYYSIQVEQCFLWLDGDKWTPLPPYATALRVFEPYNGVIEGIEPTLLKDTLYVTSGDYNGIVVKTIMASDYCVVFQDTNGREGNIIRFRPDGCEKTNREPEAIAVLNELTERVNNGELLVGINISDAKKINEYGK
jgi:hypothetical protein